MNKTLMFIKLDFRTIKPYFTLKNLLIWLFVFAIIGYGSSSAATLIGMFMMYGMIYVSYPFAVGDKNGIDTLYATLPLTKKNVVVGRYLFALCLNLLSGTVAFLLSAASMVISGKSVNITEALVITAACFIIYTFLQAFQLPLFFKLGYAKAKFLSFLPFMVFPVLVMAAGRIFDQEKWTPLLAKGIDWLGKNRETALIAIIVIWMIVLTVSAHLAYHYYRKREF